MGWICAGGFGLIWGNERFLPSLLRGSRNESKPTERDVGLVAHQVCREARGVRLKEMRDRSSAFNANAVL